MKNGRVIWTISNGEEIELDWNEFVKMVQTKEYKEYVLLPKREFEEYYKRMRMPAGARTYHANAKRKSESSKRS